MNPLPIARTLAIGLLAAVLSMPLAPTVHAQSSALPSWAVLVLRLVSTTHVEPTTGVVVAESGLVMIPLEFAQPGAEMVVLDGGKDIVRHGRPAKTIHRDADAGIAIIEVPGLVRRPPTVRAMPVTDDESILLTAFPPAEQIAEGAQPVFARGTLAVMAENAAPRVAGDEPLPNLTGPIADRCGNLVGYSRADGIQSLATDRSPAYLWADDLAAALTAAGAPLGTSPCAPETADEIPAPEQEASGPPPQESASAETETIAEPPLEESPADEPQPDAPAPEVDFDEQSEEEVPPDPADAFEVVDDLIEDGSAEDPAQADPLPPPDEDSGIPYWVVVAVVLILAAATRWWARSRSSRPSTPPGSQTSGDSGSAEAPQAPSPSVLAKRVAGGEPVTGRPVNINAVMPDGQTFQARRGLEGDTGSLVIGGPESDIPIEHASVSARHARLEFDGTDWTLEDLGSKSGSAVEGVPCYEGEVLYVGEDDRIVVGEVVLKIEAPGDS